MRSIVNILGIKSNDPIIICNRSLTVIDCIGTEIFKSGDSLSFYVDEKTRFDLEGLCAGRSSANTELYFDVHGTGVMRFATAMRHILFGESVLILRLYAEQREYLCSEHFRRDVMSSFTRTTPEIAPFLLRLYDEMLDGSDSDTPSIDAGRFILRTVNELRFRYDYPRRGVRVDSVRGCFLHGISPEALVRILLSMFYVADRAGIDSDATIGAYGAEAGIVLTVARTALPAEESGVASLISYAPGCAAAMLAMELTAAKYGFEARCVVQDSMIRLSVIKGDDTRLTSFKSWNQFEGFDEILSRNMEEMKPILLQQ
jgi:hypothetical protein